MIKHHMPPDEYFARPEYSASDVLAYAKSPRLLADMRAGVAEKDETQAMLFGTSAHMSFLEPERFEKTFIIQPPTYPAKDGEKPWHNGATYCKTWHEQQSAIGKKVINQDEYDKLRTMSARCPDEIVGIMNYYPCEVSVIANLPCSFPGLLLPARCRPDILGDRIIYDLKTIRDLDMVDGQIWKLKYHLRAEFYKQVLLAETGKDHRHVMIFVESAAPFRWEMVELSRRYQILAKDGMGKIIDDLTCAHSQKDFRDLRDLHREADPPDWVADADIQFADDEGNENG